MNTVNDTTSSTNEKLDKLFIQLQDKSLQMNAVPVNNVQQAHKDSETLDIERDINIANLSLVQTKLGTYFNDQWESKGWYNKFSHGDSHLLFKCDEDDQFILPTNNGKLLFDEIIKGYMYIKGTTRVSGIFILKSITESKNKLSLKLFVTGMFPNIQIVSTNEDGSIRPSDNKSEIPFNLLLINVIYLCMYGRAKFNAYANLNFYLPTTYDNEVINQFMIATGLHKA